MRKFLLLVLTTIVSATAFAQDDAEEAIQHRSKDSGLYYARPAGMMYDRYIKNTINNAVSKYFVPIGEDFTYVNMSNRPEVTHWVTRSELGDEGETLESDADGNCFQMVLPGDSLTVLYLYNWGETDYYNMAYNENVDSRKGTLMHYVHPSGYNGGFSWMGWVDNVTTNDGATATDSAYRFGKGKLSSGTSFMAYDVGHYGDSAYLHYVSGVWAQEHFEQDFYAPASPMYVDGIYGRCITYYTYANPSGNYNDLDYQPLLNGAVLTMDILDQETGEVMETLTATTGDWEPNANTVTTVIDTQTGGTHVGRHGYMKFSKKVDGEEVPIVIDRAITMRVSGFVNDDVDMGFGGNPFQDCDIDMTPTRIYCADPDGVYEIREGEYTSYTSSVISVSLNAVMDKVYVPEGYSDVVVTADGQHAYNIGTEGERIEFGGLYIRTALPWYDEDGKENYSLVDTPEWMTGFSVETYGEDVNSYKITFQAEENGGKEREATIYVQCKGYVDASPITLIQLDEESSAGISSVSAEKKNKTSATYNLVGQRVNDTAKGIVIKDGKKVLNH